MNTISSLSTRLPLGDIAELSQSRNAREHAPSFEETLKGFVEETNQLQQQAGQAAQQLVAGQTNDIHQVMIMGEKAGIAFELLMEVRNKLMESYQEMMRMQV